MKKIILLILFVTFSQTTFAKITDLDRPQLEVPLFSGSHLKRSFEVIGKVVIEGASVEQVKSEMRHAAQHHFGDAVLEFRISEGAGQQIYHVQNRSVQSRNRVYSQNDASVVDIKTLIGEGVIIKYERGGIHELTEDVPVSVVE